MGAGTELGRHLRIHGDVDLPLVGHQRVPFFHLVDDPILKRVTEDGRTDVDQPLFRHLGKIWVVRQVMLEPWLVSGEGQDLLDGQVLVLRDVQRLHLVHRQLHESLRQKSKWLTKALRIL